MSGQARLDRTGNLSEGGHPLVQRFIRLVNQQRCGISYVAERAGVDRKTIYDWRVQHNPTIDKLEACLNVIGYKLTIVPLDRSQDDIIAIGETVMQRSGKGPSGEVTAIIGNRTTVNWEDGMTSVEDIRNLVLPRAFDIARDCPHCGTQDSHIKLHGHVQCTRCGGIVQSCCGD